MHCDQCGKENRPNSKFCRHCGSLLSDSNNKPSLNIKNIKLAWKNPAAVLVVALLVIVLVFWCGSKAYAYFKIGSEINTAQKFQTESNFQGSLRALANLNNSSLTSSQESKLVSIEANDQKFLTFQKSFNEDIALISATSTSSDLQNVLKDLQSIDTNYPDYKNVQAEITKVQNLLVVSLQSDASASQKAAADAKAEAATAAEEKNQAEEDAQKAQSEANTEAQTAEENQIEQTENSFINALQSAENDFYSNARENFNDGIDDLNAGDDDTALVLFAKANAANQSATDAASSLQSNYQNMPDSYNTAAYDLGEAAYYQTLATNSAINQIDSSYDDSATTNSDSSEATYYLGLVNNFLSNPN